MKTGAESKLKVAILDDHQSTLDGYSLRLGQSPQFEIVGVAVFGAELEPVLAASPVNVLLLDVHVPTSPDNARITSFDTSCFSGRYVTGDVTADFLARLERDRSDGMRAQRLLDLQGGRAARVG